ncbi:hypothetical protein [Xanthomonas arboricola]|uniref:hypothetical protein n=1 Tax=Xanthomonas arboricola TaxID=56448 RepID=UPI004040B13E
MNEIEKRARELLADEYERAGSRAFAAGLRACTPEEVGDRDTARALAAIVMALTVQEGMYHAALQRIGYALGLPVGSDLTTQCIPAIEAMRRDVERLNLGAVILSHRADEWGNTRTEFTGVDLRQAIDDAARSRARAEVPHG